MKKIQKKYVKMSLFALAIVLFMGLNCISVQAATRSDSIYRGQEKGWFMNPGDTLVVYYSADGKSCISEWKDNWFYWLNNNPYTTIKIYTAAKNSGPWYYMYVDSVAPYYRSLPLFLSRGEYKFEIKNYKNGDIVNLRIR